LLALGIIGLIGFGQVVRADPVSLSTTFANSEFGASVDPGFQNVAEPATIAQSQIIPVTNLPFSGSANAAFNTDSSTTTADLTTSKFSFGFTQSITDFDTQVGGSTDGFGDMYFVANTATSYSIAGALQFTVDAEEGVDVPPAAELYTYLVDDTTDSIVYEYDNFTTDGSLGLTDPDAFVLGSATGNLVAGDEYEYYIDENISTQNTDPGLTGSGSISFGAQVTPPGGSSTPLPAALPAGLLGLAAMAYTLRRRLVTAPV
jgi:hypothetical protein